MQRINHRLRRFVGMSKLKKVALNVIAQQLTEAEIGHLRGVRIGSWLVSRDTFCCSRRTLLKAKNRKNIGLMATSKYVLPHPTAGFVTHMQRRVTRVLYTLRSRYIPYTSYFGVCVYV